jgi:hypothetical protein
MKIEKPLGFSKISVFGKVSLNFMKRRVLDRFFGSLSKN